MLRLFTRARVMQAALITITVATLSVPVWPHSLTTSSLVIDSQILEVLEKVTPQGPPTCCLECTPGSRGSYDYWLYSKEAAGPPDPRCDDPVIRGWQPITSR